MHKKLKQRSKHMKTLCYRLWLRYFTYININILNGEQLGHIDILYWQKQLFVKTVAITMPASLLVLIPSAIIAWENGAHLIVWADIFTLSSISFFLLYTTYSIKVKMGFAISLLTCFSVFLIASTASFSIGSMYLLSLGVLIALLFPRRIAYYSVGLNALIFLTFAVLIWKRAIGCKFADRYTVALWATYSLNYLFLNSIVIIEIHHILLGLQTTVNKEKIILATLQSELDSKNARNRRLAESEEHYRSLFFHNPSPMWIFNPISLVFLQVNEAAVSKYGFSYEEFEKMTIEQIRVESVDLIRDSLHQTYINQSVFSNVALHQKKNGQQFFVKVRCSTIPFEGQEALLVIANDITTEISHNEAIKQQNLKLKSIAYLQSHTIRAPLAKIKGMWTLLDQDRELVFDPEFYAHLRTSVEELDTVIKNIIQDSSIIVPTKDEDHSK